MQRNLETVSHDDDENEMFDPDFDPLGMLYATMDAVKTQQETIETLIAVHNRLNKQVYSLSKINTQLATKITKLEAKLHAIEQAAAADRQRRE